MNTPNLWQRIMAPTIHALAEIWCFIVGHKLPGVRFWTNGKTNCVRCGAYHFQGKRSW